MRSSVPANAVNKVTVTASLKESLSSVESSMQNPERFLFSENFAIAISITRARIAGIDLPSATALVEQYEQISGQYWEKQSTDEQSRAALLAWHCEAQKVLRDVEAEKA
jgi:hypothetical protein